MKRLATWLGIALTALFALVGAGVGYLFVAFPAAAPPETTQVAKTPELIERGKYLAEHVAACADCHSERDFSRFSGPVPDHKRGAGGERFGRDMGLPGEIYSRNITPAGVGHYTDGELKRAIGSGITKQGEALFPLMPYPAYSHLCERDLDAVVAYVRTLAPVQNEVPERELDFPVNLLVRTLPTSRDPWRCFDEVSGVERGRYLVTMASCTDCHTQREKGEPKAGWEFAGGVEFAKPKLGTVRSANLTPHASGLGNWSKEMFVARFQAMRSPAAAGPVKPGEFNTAMPWTFYAGMSDEDLGAMFDYLRTLKPVKNEVVKFTAP